MEKHAQQNATFLVVTVTHIPEVIVMNNPAQTEQKPTASGFKHVQGLKMRNVLISEKSEVWTPQG